MNDEVTRPHAKLGPSSSDIWLVCLQAPAEWDRYPPRPAGYAAKEGTLAHTLCEATLNLGRVPWKEGQSFEVEGTQVPISNEMLNAVQLYSTVCSIVSDIALWRIIEKQVSFSWLWKDPPPEKLFGTADFAAADATVLYVVDFKYGMGKLVHIESNSQLLCYALGAFGELQKERPDIAKNIKHVCLSIVQPRIGSKPVRQWTITLDDLLYWGYSTLKPAVDKILSGLPQPYVPGNHCFFCAASQGCEAYRKHRLGRAAQLFPEWTVADDKALDSISMI